MVVTKQTKITAAALVAAILLVLLAKVIFDISLARAILLAPVIVLSFGVVAGLVVFWGKVALQQWRGEDDPDGPRARKRAARS